MSVPSGPIPPASRKYEYGKVNMKYICSIFDVAKKKNPIKSDWPLTFEQLSIFNGVVVYQSIIPFLIVSWLL